MVLPNPDGIWVGVEQGGDGGWLDVRLSWMDWKAPTAG
jgi:hypothetical protein